jgi:hypothetical protein
MLVLDAFSSDAVPAHLVTREAFALYLRKLAPTGIIVVHVSNRYLDLEPVIAGAAHASGLVARIRLDEVTAAQARAYKSASDWMVLARDAADLAALAGDKRWIEARTRADADWTDDRSNVWRALRVLRR